MDFSALISGIIVQLAHDHPLVLSILAVMGSLRLVLKPIMAALHSIVAVTPTQKDDALLNQAEDSKVYKGLLFVLDWIASIKVLP